MRPLVLALALGAILQDPPGGDDEVMNALSFVHGGPAVKGPKDPPPAGPPPAKLPIAPLPPVAAPPALAAQLGPPAQREPALAAAASTLGGSMADRSRGAQDRLLAGAGTAASPPGPAGRTWTFKSEAFEQLRDHTAPVSRTAAGLGSSDLARIAFEGGRERPDAPGASPVDPYFRGAPKSIHDPSAVYGGSRDPRAGRGLKIRDVPMPGQPAIPGGEKGVRIGYDASALRTAIVEADHRRSLEECLLLASDAADLRRRIREAAERWVEELAGEGVAIGDVRRVSLAALAKGERPPDVRRVRGIVVDAERGDVVLLGTAEGVGAPLEADEVITAIRTIWRDGATPICSLEPPPQDRFGPQQAVVQGVPRSSPFAKVMLEADYAMKRIVLGADGAAVPGFASWKDRFGATSARVTARNWFVPPTPGVGEIRRSPDGSAYAFNARMELRTENLDVTLSGMAGTGERDAMLSAIVASFNAMLPQLEESEPLFRRLHALFDLALAANLLRLDGVDVAALHAVAALTPRDAGVPESYPAVVIPIAVHGVSVGYLGGGVTMVPSLRGDRIVTDERLGPGMAQGGFRVYGGGLVDEGDRRSEVLRGRRLARSGKCDEAIAALGRLIAADPDDAEAWLTLAGAHLQAGRTRLAARYLGEFAALGGLHAESRTLALAIADGQGRGPAPEDRARLSEYYEAIAGECEGARDFEAARVAVERAMRLAPGQPRLHLARMRAWLGLGRAGEAQQDREQAAALAGDDADTLVALARIHLQRGERKEALALAERAVKSAPANPAPYLMRALGRETLASEAALADVAKALELEPGRPEALLTRAHLLYQEGDVDGAAAECGRALRKHPLYGDALVFRANLRATRDVAQAVDDLTKALLVRPRDADILFSRGIVLVKALSDTQGLVALLGGEGAEGRVLRLLSTSLESDEGLPGEAKDPESLARALETLPPERVLAFFGQVVVGVARRDLQEALKCGLVGDRAEVARRQVEALKKPGEGR
jgi:tetratricopeptide (TPR) repeat protein